ncbi:MAG: DUF1735 domain-containing protein [Chitinophagales bacterium]
MKRIKHLTGISFLFVSVALALASCVKKDDMYDETTSETNRKQIVQLYGADEEINLLALNLVPAVEDIVLIEVVRYPNSAADANQPLTIKLNKTTAPIDDYNTANGTNYIELPLASYTLGSDISSLTFAPGESIKQVKINLKKDQLDLSKQYAIGFTITDVGTGAVLNDDMKTVLYAIGLKNAYDGVYSYVSGLVTRYTAPGVPANDAFSGPLGPQNPDVEMVTLAAYSVGIEGLTWSGGTTGVGGIGGLKAVVDPATNLVTMSATEAPGGLTLTNWAGHVNKYDPATKTFTLAFRWNPTSTTREYEVVFKYKGPR